MKRSHSPSKFLFAALLLLAAPACDSAADASSAGLGGHDAATGQGGSGAASATSGAGASNDTAPELGTDTTRALTVIATAADGLDTPRDLAFAPEHPDRLWTANAAYHGVVIVTNPGTNDQSADKRVDAYAQHFMDRVSSIAFGVENRFASCQESRDPWNDVPQPEDDFMGPTLWLADLDIFAVYGQAFPWVPGQPEGSHIDMLHESPLCMGIAHEDENVYWAFDGLHGHLVRYDFADDHGPGGGDHDDARVRRFVDAAVTRKEGVPSHLVFDPATQQLFIADTGGGRIMRLDTKTGTVTGKATNPPNLDGLKEYVKVEGAAYDVVVSGLVEPSGIALSKGRLFVTDHATGELFAFTMGGEEIARIATGSAGLMGITAGPDGKLWYVDGEADTVVRIDP